jgi:hypothetical protein
MADYILPNFLVKALSRPSERTQMESSIVGILVMALGSLGLVSHLIINGIISGFWYIFLAIFSELGVLSFQFSVLSQVYQQYRTYKLTNNLYPLDYKLKIKIEQAKLLKEELEKIINGNSHDNLIKSQKEVK